MLHIRPCLWFDGQAEEAAQFYTSLFPDACMGPVIRNTNDAPGAAGSVMLVHFELNGQGYTALNGGPQFRFNESFSLTIVCTGQEEIDYYWQRLTEEGGQESMCGWLRDKYGLSWQVVPASLERLLSSENAAGVARVMRALVRMRKLNEAELERAFAGC